MKNWKRWLSMCLAGAMCITALGACSGKDNGTGGDQTSQGDNTAALGRYVEEEIALPLSAENEQVFSMLQNADGTLELYTGFVEEPKQGEQYLKEIKKYIYDGSSWSESPAAWLKTAVESTVMIPGFEVKKGSDGTEYLMYHGEGYSYHILRSSDGVQYEEVLTDLLGKKLENYDFYPTLDAFEGMADGRMFVSSYWIPSGIYNADGTMYMALEQAHSSTDQRSDYAFSDKEIVVRGERGFERYSIADQNQMEEIQAMENAQFQYIQMDKDGGLYACDDAGIHHISKGGTIWETIVDGSLNSLGMPSLWMSQFFVSNDDSFYAMMTDGVQSHLFRYVYDSNIASVPSITLNVYGLKESATIQQAAALFQKANPDVRVVVGSANSSMGDMVDEDVIRALNTELLGGKGADILLLDGLPVQSYIEKGVLADITDVIAPYEQEGTLLQTVLDAYRQDGKFYRLPARIALPIVIGDEAALAALDNLEALKKYHEDGNSPIFRTTNYENLLRMNAQMFYDEVFAADGSFKPGALKNLLEATKISGEKCDAKTLFEEAQSGRDADYFNMVLDRGFQLMGMYNYIAGSTAIGIEDVSGESGVMTASSIAEQMGKELHSLKGIYLPQHIIGINAATQYMELAKEFVSMVFSMEVQQDNFYDGISINTAASKVWSARKVETMLGFSTTSDAGVDIEVTCTWPGEERAYELLSMAEQCTTAVDIDEVLMKMIIEEAAGYFDGEITVEEAVSAIENKANLYFSE